MIQNYFTCIITKSFETLLKYFYFQIKNLFGTTKDGTVLSQTKNQVLFCAAENVSCLFNNLSGHSSQRISLYSQRKKIHHSYTISIQYFILFSASFWMACRVSVPNILRLGMQKHKINSIELPKRYNFTLEVRNSEN